MLTLSDLLQLGALCLSLPSFLISATIIIQATLKYTRANNEEPTEPTQDETGSEPPQTETQE